MVWLVEASQWLDALANRTVFGLDADEHQRLKDMIYEVWSGPVGVAPDGEAVLRTLRSILDEMGGAAVRLPAGVCAHGTPREVNFHPRVSRRPDIRPGPRPPLLQRLPAARRQPAASLRPERAKIDGLSPRPPRTRNGSRSRRRSSSPFLCPQFFFPPLPTRCLTTVAPRRNKTFHPVLTPLRGGRSSRQEGDCRPPSVAGCCEAAVLQLRACRRQALL